MLRLGVLGAGAIFAEYDRASNALHGVEIVAVADPDPTRRAAATRGGRRVVASSEALLDGAIDGVLVLAPNASHASLVEAAIARGLDVLCEKPLATSVADATRLMRLAEDRGIVLHAAMHCRYRPEVRFLSRMLRGRIVTFEQIYRERWMEAPKWYFDPALSGGGVLLDVGINQLDWITWFLPPLEIESVDVDRGDQAVEVDCRVAWRWSGGHGTTDLSWRADREEKRTRIVMDTGDVIELEHRAHSASINGRIKGPWLNDEYVRALADFSRRSHCRGPDRGPSPVDNLALLRRVYARAGLPFLA